MWTFPLNLLMKLIILGSGTFYPEKNRSNPAYLLDIEGETVLLDCGSGTCRQIAKAGRNIWDISRIFFSHLHIDHTNDLIPLLFAYKYYPYDVSNNLKNLFIHGHPEFEKFYHKLLEIYKKWIISNKRQVKIPAIIQNEIILNRYKVQCFKADHTEESLIFKFTDSCNKTFVYSGDTDYCENLVLASRSADLLLIECSSSDENPIRGHMTPKKIQKLIKAAKPSSIIITHIHPEINTKALQASLSETNNYCSIIVADDLAEVEI